jgi:putative (di)nucleoside polyphosphate hydrolase
MPQGGIDKGEDPEAAALRELQEEAGVRPDRVEVMGRTPDWVTYDLPPELLGKVWGGKYRGQKQLWFLLRFLGEDAEIDIATEHPEFRDWRWVTADEMLEAIVPFKRAVYAEVVAAFRDRLA